MNIDINDLANQLDLTRQNLNYHIVNGRAGDVKKDGDCETCPLIILPENVVKLSKWLLANGRSINKSKIRNVKNKYEEMIED